jgi:hypothetical protein
MLKCEGHIKMNLRDNVFEDVEWIQPAQGTVQWRVLIVIVMNLQVP